LVGLIVSWNIRGVYHSTRLIHSSPATDRSYRPQNTNAPQVPGRR
jgi:hypothetical protein